MAISKAEFAIFESVKPSHIRRHKRSWRFENGVKNRHSYKTSEGPRPRMEAPEVGEYERKIVPTPSWVWENTTARWGVVMEYNGVWFITSASPAEDGRIDIDSIREDGRIVGVTHYWAYHDNRFEIIGYMLLENKNLCTPESGRVIVHEDGTIWYRELFCEVSFF